MGAVPFFLLVDRADPWRRVSPLRPPPRRSPACSSTSPSSDTVIRCGVVLPLAFLFAFAVGARLERDRSLLGLRPRRRLLGCAFDAPTGADASGHDLRRTGASRCGASGGSCARADADGRELEARTARAAQARDERARLEVATDRARLSAELDELLQRRLGELAGWPTAATAPTPRRRAATLATSSSESRRTLEEMRAMVGVLRDDASDAPIAAQPALTQLDALLVRAKGAGARLTVEGNPRVLPAGVELSAYRVVEHLLDALEDAPDVEVARALRRRRARAARRRARPRRGGGAASSGRASGRSSTAGARGDDRGGRAEALVSLPMFAAV